MSSLYTTQAAAELLHEQIPGRSVRYWTQRLVNARRTDRTQAHPIPFQMLGKAVTYTPQALSDFMEYEKARQIGQTTLSDSAAKIMRAFGVGEVGGSTLGRKFDCQVVAHPDGVGGLLIQLIVKNPMLVFKLSLDEAGEFSANLKDTLDHATRIMKEKK